MRSLLSISLLLSLFIFWGCQNKNKQDNIWGIKSVEPSIVKRPSRNEDLKVIAVNPLEAAPAVIEKTADIEVPIPAKTNLVAVNESGAHIVTMTYPSVDYGVIYINKVMPREVGLNDSFDYFIKVTNLTDTTLTDIVIMEELPNDFEFIKASPIAKRDANRLQWKIDSLGPKTSRQITVTGKGTSTNFLDHCTTITQAMQVHTNVKIVQSKLELVSTLPTEVLLCDSIPLELVLTNSGSGTAQDVRIVDSLPAGLQTIDGKNELIFEVSALAAGQSQRFSTQLRAIKSGVFINKAVASSGIGLITQSAPIVMTVRQPKLAIVKTGPQRMYLGRPVAYEITVSNNGDGPANNTVLEEIIPTGVTSIEATSGANLSGTKLVWQLGTLEANTSRKVRVSYMPTNSGTITNSATANAYCAEAVTASMNTEVSGIAALHLDVDDLEDPVDVGSQTTYVITVTNQGSASDMNIRIICTLEDKIQYVSSSGATSGSIMGNTVNFTALPSLGPKNKATWRVIVRGIRPGDVRFKVNMSSDQLARPVEETEATHIYE